MRHLTAGIAGLVAVASLSLAGCSTAEKEAFDWGSQELVLLTSQGPEKFGDIDSGHLWGATVGQDPVSLETTGLEGGQLLIEGDTLHFDERENSLALSRGSSEVTSVGRDSKSTLTTIGSMSTPKTVFRLWNGGFVDDANVVRDRFSIERSGEVSEFSLPYSVWDTAHCGDNTYALADKVVSNRESFESPQYMLLITPDGDVSVVGEWNADDGQTMSGSIGCLGDEPRWTEQLYESEDSETVTEVVVGLDSEGERIVKPLTADGPRQLEADLGHEQYGQITCTGRTWSFKGGLYESCGDGAVQRIDLDTGAVATVVDASGLATTSSAYVHSYVSEDGFVALAEDYNSDDFTLGIYDKRGVEVERLVYEGLTAEAISGGENLYDFVAVNHLPLR